MTESASSIEFESINEEVLAAVPEAREVWNARKAALEIASLLVRLRRSKSLRQADVAERTGWDKAFVSRLERPSHKLPSLATIIRYATACDSQAGLVFASLNSPQVHVDDAVALTGGAEAEEAFSVLRDRDIEVREAALSTTG
jgi:transcriptional regulator with XRE-family HTH domain